MGDPGPQFETFMQRALRDPEVRKAYERARRRYVRRERLWEFLRRCHLSGRR